jgi:prepilin-type N-terminal cleavage/methylation domain-containing protein/prepilin-type processing-associated H-X9-DG protein
MLAAVEVHMILNPVATTGQRHRAPAGFSLIELLVVVGMIALLLAILLPSLSGAREQARAAVCGSSLKQISMAANAYGQEHHGWLVGSPNTSGNGAPPGFAAGAYTATASRDHYPALQVFDWASPLLKEFGSRAPRDFKQRYTAAVSVVPQCPSNRRKTGPVNFPALTDLIPMDTLAPSYAMSRFFTYVGDNAQTGEVAGTLWWHEDCIPPNYTPKPDRISQPTGRAFLADTPKPDRISQPTGKAFLADGHIVSKTEGEIANANWGFSSQGAWRSHDDGPVTYRGEYLREEMWRHRGTINIAAFDGHVERQREGDSTVNGGKGSEARRAKWWFPSGTKTEKLPSKATCEPEIVVP